ncbi:hypothetical protein FSP39_008098 [Pinctada imbricata]|uniref:NADH dehydrogenase [ubiquinone] 1 alpha subcomplex assembly factor 2 n=1 Tax=Pinctada imbricata TaxID=66713 RepID=A0AA89C0V1_PINIB|nr:hypothetical protein FSP39_008098 [Pinctada imbricata]
MSLTGYIQVLIRQTRYVSGSSKHITRNYGIKSFWDRFRSKLEQEGKLVGEDLFGNKYYEKESVNSTDHSRKSKRWIEREDDPDLDQQYHQEFEMPIEWRAWLQHKRSSPPTEMEIKKNVAMMMRTKKRAVEVAEREAKEREEMGLEKVDTSKLGDSEFPIYPEYEVTPQIGKDRSKDKDVDQIPKK